MKLSLNRAAALLYVVLSLLPLVSVALIIDALGGIDQLAATYRVESALLVLLAQFIAIGLLSLAFAAVCASERKRSRAFCAMLFLASLFLALAAGFVIAWLTALFYLMPSGYLWLLYRRTFNAHRTA